MKGTQKKRSSSSLLNLVVQLRNIYKPKDKKKKKKSLNPLIKMVLHRQSCVLLKKNTRKMEKRRSTTCS